MEKRRLLTMTLTALLTASLAVPAYARSADVMGLAEGGYETAAAGVSVTQENEYVWPGIGQTYEICVGYGGEDGYGDAQPDEAPTEYGALAVTLPDGFELWDVDLGEWAGADGDVTGLTVTAGDAEYAAEYEKHETQTGGDVDGDVTGAWVFYSRDEWGLEEEVTDLSVLEGGFTVTLPDGGTFVSVGVTGSGNIIGVPLTVTGTFSDATTKNKDDELVCAASVSAVSGSGDPEDGTYEASVTGYRDYYEVGGITVTASKDGSSADISISGVSVKGARPYESGAFRDIALKVDLGGSAVVSVSSLGGWDGTASVRQPVDSDGEYILSYTTTDSATFTISQTASGRNEITQTEPIVLHVRNSADTDVSYSVTATLGEVRYLVNGGYVDDAVGGDSTATDSTSFTLDADGQTGSGSSDDGSGDAGGSGSSDTGSGDTGGSGSSDDGSGDAGGSGSGSSDAGGSGSSDDGSGDAGGSGSDTGSDDGGASDAGSSGGGADADDAADAADADGMDPSDEKETVDLSKLGLTAVKGTATGGSSISLLSVTPVNVSSADTSGAYGDAEEGAASDALGEELTEEEIGDMLESGEITEEEAEELLAEITDEEDEKTEDGEEDEEDEEGSGAITILPGSSYSEDSGNGFFSGGTGSGDGLSILGLDDEDTAIYETPLFWVLVAAAAAAAVLAVLLGRQRRVNRSIEQRLSDTSAVKNAGDVPEAADDGAADGSRSGRGDDIS